MNRTLLQMAAPLLIGRRFRIGGENSEDGGDEIATVADIRLDRERWGAPGPWIVLIDEYGIEYPFDIDDELPFVDGETTDAPPAAGETWMERSSGRTMTIEEIDLERQVVMLRSERRFTGMPLEAFLERFVRA